MGGPDSGSGGGPHGGEDVDETPRGSDDVVDPYNGYNQLRYGDNIASDENAGEDSEMRRYVREEERLQGVGPSGDHGDDIEDVDDVDDAGRHGGVETFGLKQQSVVGSLGSAA